MDRAPSEPGRFKYLSKVTQEDVADWKHILEEGGKSSAWVYADKRGQGSTYAASVLVNYLVRHGRGVAYTKAITLCNILRDSWNADPDLPVQTCLEDFLEADVLWVDDLNAHGLPVKLWMDHINERLIMRAKEGRTTIVATSFPPNDPPFDEITQVIESCFTPIYATR